MCWSTSVKRSTVDIYLSDPQPCWWNLCSWLILDTSIHLTFAFCFSFPTPPSPHFIHTYIILHVFHSYSKHTLWRYHLHLFRLGFDSCLQILLFFHFGSEIFIHTHRSQWPRRQFTRLHRLQFYHFSENTDSKNPVWDETVPNPNSWRPRAKHPTNILVWKKKSVLLACLWLSQKSIETLEVIVLQATIVPEDTVRPYTNHLGFLYTINYQPSTNQWVYNGLGLRVEGLGFLPP